MKVGSLFTGYGGLDIAVGGDLAWYSEIEPAACEVLAYHYPGVPNLGDITAINWADVEPVNILTGGYPCQPFSTAGNRKGKNDVRHLWPNVLNAIRAIRPRYAILENVAGHLSLGFADVLADLAEIGWDAEWGTYRASDVGAPHRRERIFIIAFNPDNDGTLTTERGQSLFESTIPGGQQQYEGYQWELARGSNPLTTYTYSKGLQGHNGRSSKASTRGHGHVKQGARALATDTAVTIRRKSTLQGTQQGESRGHPRIVWGKYAPAIARWESVLERNAPDPIVERNDKCRLNPRFVEWMMGLPDGWVTGHGLSAAKELKMLGNGVVPQQAYEAITQLIERIRKVEE